jgi:hypothetical protein
LFHLFCAPYWESFAPSLVISGKYIDYCTRRYHADLTELNFG